MTCCDGFRRYALAAMLPCFPLAEFHQLALDAPVTWMDAVFYLFRGADALPSSANVLVEVPVLWLWMLGGSLVLNLEPPYSELCQQVLVRCRSRRRWCSAQYVRTVLCSCLYFGVVLGSTAVYTWLSGNVLSLRLSAGVLKEAARLSNLQILLVGLALPCCSIVALNLMQWALRFCCRPVLATLCCIGLCTLSVFSDSRFLPGSGAMTCRTLSMVSRGESLFPMLGSSIGICAGCLAVGLHRFSHMDILPREE